MNKELTPELEQFVRKFACLKGRTWKAQMRQFWFDGTDERHPWMRQLRNNYGPDWLKNYRLEK